MAYTSEIELNGDLWELGVLIPIKNPTMERFEQRYSLYEGVDVGSTYLDIINLGSRVKPGCTIYVGPSNDTTRDTDGNLLYYGKYETFKITNIEQISTVSRITFTKLNSNQSSYALNSYVAGDPVVVRPIAESWDFLQSTDFSSLKTIGNSLAETNFDYKRADSLDQYKGFSQEISCAGSIGDYDVGIVQNLDQYQRTIISRIAGAYSRMSAWIKTSFTKTVATLYDDIDENITGIASNDRDEGVGAIDTRLWDSVDERSQLDLINDSTITPYIRASFFDTVGSSSPALDQSATPGAITTQMYNMLLSDILQIPEKSISAKIGVYAKFSSSPKVVDAHFYINNVIMEHCVGTTKEENGFYQVDINPKIGVGIKGIGGRKIFRDVMGRGYAESKTDTLVRYEIIADWENRSSAFIEDMKTLESWNNEGFPIILRPKMPGILPNVLLCNMVVSNLDPQEGSGNYNSRISITFEEITA